MAAASLAAGRIEAAATHARRGLDANPAFTPGLTTLALCLVRLGRNEESRVVVRRLVEIAPDTRLGNPEER